MEGPPMHTSVLCRALCVLARLLLGQHGCPELLRLLNVLHLHPVVRTRESRRQNHQAWPHLEQTGIVLHAHARASA